MIWEAALWMALKAVEAAEVPVQWAMPSTLTEWLQLQINTYGYPTIGAVRQWGTTAGWQFLTFALFVGLSLAALAFALRYARSIRDWMG